MSFADLHKLRGPFPLTDFHGVLGSLCHLELLLLVLECVRLLVVTSHADIRDVSETRFNVFPPSNSIRGADIVFLPISISYAAPSQLRRPMRLLFAKSPRATLTYRMHLTPPLTFLLGVYRLKKRRRCFLPPKVRAIFPTKVSNDVLGSLISKSDAGL